MKKVLIVSLVGLNLALLAGLVLGMHSPTAQAQQTGWRTTDYLLFTGSIESDYDAVYVFDVASQKLAAWKFDRNTKRLRAFRTKELAKDFVRRAP